jgi:hypothetical protein
VGGPFGIRRHTQLPRADMSGLGTQNLNKVSEYDKKSITEPKSQWQLFFGGVVSENY